MPPCSLPLFSSHTVVVDRKGGAAGRFLECDWVCLSLWCCCVSVHVDRQDVRSILWERGGGKPVTLTYLLWFQSPHIPTYTLTHPVPAAAAALRMAVFHSKTPHSHIFLHITLFYLKSCTSRKKRVCASLTSWVVVVFESEAESYCVSLLLSLSWIKHSVDIMSINGLNNHQANHLY